MENHKQSKKSSFRFILLLALILFCWFLGRFFTDFDEEYFKAFFSRYPVYLSGSVFSLLYVALTFVAWFTKDLLKVAGAFVFGAYYSTFFIWIAEILNACLLFFLARKLGREFVEKKTKGKFKAFDERVGDAGFWDVFALRAIILVPYRFLDLGMGLTKISFRKYLWAVILGSPPRIFMIQYYLLFMKDLLTKDLAYIIDYVSTNIYITAFSFFYLAVISFLVYRLKKLLWG